MAAPDVLRLRLRAQHLSSPSLTTPEAVVGALCAMQAQEYAAAKWAIGQRARGVVEPDVDLALARGTILRTHVLRPTWHLVLADDIRWMLALTAPRVNARMVPYDRKLALTAKVYMKTNALVARALEGGKHLTRAELSTALRRGGVTAEGQRLGHIVLRAELDQVICSGAPRGKQLTYALVDERAPRARRLSGDQALAELTLRYFQSHGPATATDYAWWASWPRAEARRAIAMVERDLERITVDGRTYWHAPASRPGPAPKALLLQGFDEYLVGYTESRDLIASDGIARHALGTRTFLHALAVDGKVVGHWRRVPSGKTVDIETSVPRPLTAAEQRALDVELRRYRRFVG